MRKIVLFLFSTIGLLCLCHDGRAQYHGGTQECCSEFPRYFCHVATDITPLIMNGKVNCIRDCNFDGNSLGGTPACWKSAADHDVWFKFTPAVGGTWTISLDNGIKEYGEDTQLALYDTCGGAALACSEDDGDCNTRAAGITLNLVAGTTYYLQIDIAGTKIGKFALTIFENGTPVNDCLLNAIDIQTLYNSITVANPFECDGEYIFNNYCYDDVLDPLFAPDWTVLNTPGANDNVQTQRCQGQARHHDVWFKFKYDSNIPSYLSVYPKNGCNLYGIEIYKATDGFTWGPGMPCVSPLLTGLTYLGGSLPDGVIPANAPNSPNCCQGNAAAGNFLDHPRVNLQNLLVQPLNGDQLYVRIYDYDDPLDVLPPPEGLFRLAFELAPINSCLSADNIGVNNSCCNSLFPQKDLCRNDCLVFTNLSNAGMDGGLNGAVGSTCMPGGRAHEPALYTVPARTTRFSYNDCQPGCQENPDSIKLEPVSVHNNNSVYYRFRVCDTTMYTDLSTVDTILGVPVDDSILYISDLDIVTPQLFAGIIACHGIVVDVQNGKLGELGPLPSPITIIVPLPDSCCIPVTCVTDVEFCFSNLKYCGVNGATAEYFVIPADTNCTDNISPGIAAFGIIDSSSCDSCVCMASAHHYLPAGEYDLVVDGDLGSLVSFDLKIDVKRVIPGTDVLCESCPPATLKDNRTQDGSLTTGMNAREKAIKPAFLAPNPAGSYVDFGFSSGIDGTAYYRIIDLSGKQVDQGSFPAIQGVNKHRFNTQLLHEGMYVLIMQINDVQLQLKLLIDKQK